MFWFIPEYRAMVYSFDFWCGRLSSPTISPRLSRPYSSFINGLNRCTRSSIWNQSSCRYVPARCAKSLPTDE